MARPTKAKEAKPKAEVQSGSGDSALGGLKGILINSALTIIIGAIFVGANYMVVSHIIDTLKPESSEHGEGNHNQGIESMASFPYELKDFIINLQSATERRYLKVTISLDVERHEGEPIIGLPPGASGGAHGGGLEGGHGGGYAGGSGGGPKPIAPKEFYNSIMEPYKMPIRDIIITKLSSMSAEELSSISGKEMAKDKIKEEINTILPSDRQVLRVNFGDFIIQ